MQDRGAIGPSASISLHDRQEPACSHIADKRRRSSSRRQRRRRIYHRRKQQPRHNARTGSHGRNRRWRNRCGCSCWRCSSRRELRHRESWLDHRDRDHAVLQHRRDEALRRCYEEVRPRAPVAEGPRQVRPEDHRGEDHQGEDHPQDPEEDHRHRGPEEDRRA
jgi:hypothetical protein